MPNESATRLCLTPGDPTGIGPEITARFLADLANFSEFNNLELDIIGDFNALTAAARHLDIELPERPEITYSHIQADLPGSVSYLAIEQAIEKIATHQASALVTGPISKRHLKQAGYDYHGHTEILEALSQRFYPTQLAKAEMLFVYHHLRLLLLTRHIPLSQVSSELMNGDTLTPMRALARFLIEQLGISLPRLAMLGFNPHAGEVGGVEEQWALLPAMAALNDENLADIHGPFAADAFFRGFDMDTFAYDAVIAAYHDQGLIPFKLIAGFDAVNVTIGLPFLRTSVSHGTAEDIVGKNIASPASLIAAVRIANDYSRTTCAISAEKV